MKYSCTDACPHLPLRISYREGSCAMNKILKKYDIPPIFVFIKVPVLPCTNFGKPFRYAVNIVSDMGTYVVVWCVFDLTRKPAGNHHTITGDYANKFMVCSTNKLFHH
ncbi:hypothetical protein NPIL_37761 [Nephila pilipes]|uniref:Uncharacterized protein n=1 Tax=Nephila pilipes TaxID=299642 RepID=A0A8X6QSC9_NEPPI|nr:hypothetical protein NPIL_37761 [Nephila pilipes]